MSDDHCSVLLDFVRTKLLSDERLDLTADTRLASEHVVDSMGLVMLAAFVEERFGVRVDDADLRAGGIETVAEMAALIDRGSR
jgi:acyl carrier protein